MSHYTRCLNCGEPECMDSDTGVHRRDDGTVCPDPRDAEVEGLRAEVARLTRERDELARWRETHTVTPTIRIRAEAAEAEVERRRVEYLALGEAYEKGRATIRALTDETVRLRAALDANRRFPIQRGPSVLWAVIAPHEAQAKRNHGGQTLERLAERGGLDPIEALAVVEDREFPRDRSVFDEHRARWAEFVRKTDAERLRAAAIPEDAEEIVAQAMWTHDEWNPHTLAEADASNVAKVRAGAAICRDRARAVVKTLRAAIAAKGGAT